MENNHEKLLDKFIEVERKKLSLGSGDDGFYEKQLSDYINKQRALWIEFVKFVIEQRDKPK